MEIQKMCSVASSLVFSFDSAGEIFASTTKGAARLPEMGLVWRKGELKVLKRFSRNHIAVLPSAA